MKAVFTQTEQKLKADFRVLNVVPVDGLATLENLNEEIENRQNADIEISNNLSEIDAKVDGININLTKQIDDLEQDVNDKYNELIRDIDDLTDVFEESVVSLQGEDNALQTQINSHSQSLTQISQELNNKISKVETEHLISQIQQFKHEIVNQLPVEGSSSVMYLVPKQNTPNVYEEWIWLEDEGRYEDIGSTAIDLTEYAKLTDLPTKLSQFQNDINYLTEHQNLDHLSTKNELLVSFLQCAKADFSNVTPTHDYVISETTYGGGESGKRKWKNGRFEQWGVCTTSEAGETEFTMHESFKDMLFSVFIEIREKGNFFHYAYPSDVKKFKARTTDITGVHRAVKIQWRAYGYWK